MKSLLVLALAVVGSLSAQPPHVIFNVIDDWGHNDVGFNNPSGVKTPNIDALMTSGVELTDYYVFRFCSPTRSTFMTGRYPHHIGQHTEMNLNPTPGVACGVNLNYTFIPALLKKAGYVSYALGKWHLGYHQPAFTPTYRGFKHYLGYYSGAEEHFTHLKGGPKSFPNGTSRTVNYFDLANNTETTLSHKGSGIAPGVIGTCPNAGPGGLSGPDLRLLDPKLFKEKLPEANGDSKNDDDEANSFCHNGTFSVYLYGNETVRLIEQHESTTPMYIYLAWNSVHSPCEAPEEYVHNNMQIQDGQRRQFAAMINAVDDAFLQIVNSLKAKGMYANTIIIVTTDNGGNLGGAGNNLPLRGGKYTFWEGGTRGLGFVHSALLPAQMVGQQYKGLMHAADWYTTIAKLAGLDDASTGPVASDGVDMWSAIVSNGTSPRAAVVYNILSTDKFSAPLTTDGNNPSGCYPRPLLPNPCYKGAVRKGEYKLVVGYPGWKSKETWDGWYPLPTGEEGTSVSREVLVGMAHTAGMNDFYPLDGPRYSNYTRPCVLKPCLFNVGQDATEHNDIADANPAIVADLLALFDSQAASEVSVEASGLCAGSPTGVLPDPRCAESAEKNLFWEPWM